MVFDLDGTLVDSLPGIEASLRAALAALYPQRVLAEGAVRPLVGPQLPLIMAALWPDFSQAEIAALLTAYRTHYLAESCAKTEAFSGVGDLLGEFYRAGARLFLLTNKPRGMARMILNQLGWSSFFQEICCPDDEKHPFASKAAGAVSLRDRQALAPASTLLVGDALDDAQAAAAAGFTFVRAAYGYGEAAGHGSSSGEIQAGVGAFADLRPFVFSQASNPPTDDHPQSLR